jgi:hypothetical protein
VSGSSPVLVPPELLLPTSGLVPAELPRSAFELGIFFKHIYLPIKNLLLRPYSAILPLSSSKTYNLPIFGLDIYYYHPYPIFFLLYPQEGKI